MREVSPRMRIYTCVSREHPPFANPGNATGLHTENISVGQLEMENDSGRLKAKW